MLLLFFRATKCPLAEFPHYIVSLYPSEGSFFKTVSDTVNRMYSTEVRFSLTLPFSWLMHDGLKSLRVLLPNWLSISIASMATVSMRSLLLLL